MTLNRSMAHWGGHQMCVIDTETTGLDPQWNEILQIAIVPLNADIKVRKEITPFVINLRPEFPERIDKEALKVNKANLESIMVHGFDQDKAKDLLRDWVDKLRLPLDRHGKPCKILPLGQNYAFDRGFIMKWLGREMYDEFFDYHFADTMVAAAFLNDKAAMHAEPPPFRYINLKSICGVLKIDNPNAHDALSDCLTTAEVYRRLCMQGIL